MLSYRFPDPSDPLRMPWLAHTPQPDDPPPGEPDAPPIGDPPPEPGEAPRADGPPRRDR
ncbi:hypothetical protein [Paraburkholderia pallida]|uniref:hypothetical protein n=1 Tax=Paraburkholderia pallida TaxID=2547399 RepID=UPI00143047C2|nr:hypothetical protein [Paraburkholderia pallida]